MMNMNAAIDECGHSDIGIKTVVSRNQLTLPNPLGNRWLYLILCSAVPSSFCTDQ